MVEKQVEDHHPEDGLSPSRLTKAEIQYLRELMEADKRARWAWATGRVWAAWIGGTIVAVYGVYDTAEKLIKRITGSG